MADDRRRELVSLAATLFDRDGYHATNVEALARAAGIRKSTLYHYFSSKDEILFWIHEEFIDLLIEKAEGRPPEMPPHDALLEVMADVLELMHTHRGHVRVFFEHHRELPAESKRTIRAKRDHYQQLVEELILRSVAAGTFRDLDVRLVTLAVFGLCNWAYQWYRPDGPLTAREIAELFWDILVNGLSQPVAPVTDFADQKLLT